MMQASLIHHLDRDFKGDDLWGEGDLVVVEPISTHPMHL